VAAVTTFFGCFFFAPLGFASWRHDRGTEYEVVDLWLIGLGLIPLVVWVIAWALAGRPAWWRRLLFAAGPCANCGHVRAEHVQADVCRGRGRVGMCDCWEYA
jgi:hypothetical protein